MNINRKTLLVTLFFNILFLVAGITVIFQRMGQQDDITLYDIPLYNSGGIFHSDNADYDERNRFTTNLPVTQYEFVGKTGPLRSGIYEVSVYYKAYDDRYSVYYEADRVGNSYPAFYADSYTLSALDDTFSSRVWVNSDLDCMDIHIKCGNGDLDFFSTGSSFYLDRIEIRREYWITASYNCLKLFLILVVLNGLFWVWRNPKKIQDNGYILVGLTCIFLVTSLSLMTKFNTKGHDMLFHYARIIGLADGLRNGEFPVRIQSGWFHGYGYAVSVCYGDILLYFPAVLYILGMTVMHAYKWYIAVINLGTVLISYFSFKKISRSQYTGVACTALYCLSVNRTLNVYTRSAAGEYSAFMFLPLIVLGVHDIYKIDAELKEKTGKGWLFLGLGMTGVIQTHVLSAQMVCIVLALTVLLLIRKMSGKVFFSFVKSVLLSVCLNLGFLLPLVEYSTDSLNVLSEYMFYAIQQYGLSIFELFTVGTTGFGGAQRAIDGIQQAIPESIGISMDIVIIAAWVFLLKCPSWKRHEKKEWLLIMLLSGTMLWMATCYFPWNRLAAVEFLKQNVSSIQYPWRFLTIAMPLLTYMACLIFMKIEELTKSRRNVAYLLTILCFISATQSLYCMDDFNRSVSTKKVYDGHYELNARYIVSGKEYLLQDTDVDLALSDLDVAGENIRAEILERKGLRMDVYCQAGENAWIEVPQFAYWHYECRDVETEELYPVLRGTNNRIHVDLPDRYQGTLRIDFVEPWYWRMAEIVSAVSFIFLIIYVCRKRSWFVSQNLEYLSFIDRSSRPENQ